jgi:transcriptional regulator with XRE-family HTH domain
VAKELGQRIRETRQQIGISAAALAKRAKIDPAALLRIERGENTNPSFATIARVADALRIPLDSLKSSKTSAAKISAVEEIRREEELAELHRLSSEIAKRLERLLKA